MKSRAFPFTKISSIHGTILLYALALACLVVFLKMIQYKFLVRDLSMEFYIGIVAILFTAVGIWSGFHFTNRKNTSGNEEPLKETFAGDVDAISKLGISKRELEVLQLMASGLSNQEIADKLFVSLNTIKTHTTNIFVKLDVKRRTQAVHIAKELGIIG